MDETVRRAAEAELALDLRRRVAEARALFAYTMESYGVPPAEIFDDKGVLFALGWPIRMPGGGQVRDVLGRAILRNENEVNLGFQSADAAMRSPLPLYPAGELMRLFYHNTVEEPEQSLFAETLVDDLIVEARRLAGS